MNIKERGEFENDQDIVGGAENRYWIRTLESLPYRWNSAKITGIEIKNLGESCDTIVCEDIEKGTGDLKRLVVALSPVMISINCMWTWKSIKYNKQEWCREKCWAFWCEHSNAWNIIIRKGIGQKVIWRGFVAIQFQVITPWYQVWKCKWKKYYNQEGYWERCYRLEEIYSPLTSSVVNLTSGVNIQMCEI